MASGIAEDLTETDQLLDDLIKEQETDEEEMRKEKDEENATEALLMQQGKGV